VFRSGCVSSITSNETKPRPKKPFPSIDADCLKRTPFISSLQRRADRRTDGHQIEGQTMTYTATKLAAATVLAFGMLTSVCHAYSAEQEQLCSGDAMRLCSSEIPDIDRVTACMIRNKSQLSEGCKSVFAPAPAYQPASLRTSKPVNLVPARIR
jgi:hypothetical protein